MNAVLKGHSVWEEEFTAESEPDTEQAKEITRIESWMESKGRGRSE